MRFDNVLYICIICAVAQFSMRIWTFLVPDDFSAVKADIDKSESLTSNELDPDVNPQEWAKVAKPISA